MMEYKLAKIHNQILIISGLMIAVLITYTILIIFRVIVSEEIDSFVYGHIDLFILSLALFVGVFIIMQILLYNRLTTLIDFAMEVKDNETLE